jgi:parvulin-like peptidyl-prolyl isomerase
VINRIFLLTLAATGLGAALISGCGNSVPANGVATVGDSVIRKADFDKWLRTASQGQSRSSTAAVPDPPSFANCVASLKGQPTPKGTKQPTDAQLKKQCKQQYNQLKGQVMQFLIQAQWVEQEAGNMGIKVSDAEVKRSFEDQKKQAFPNDKAYQKFLKTSGMTETDILFRVRIDMLQQKLTQKVTEKESKVTDSDVQAYYDKNKKRFAQPERRDLRVVLTKTQGKAKQAKAALAKGQSWKSVSKKFSIDQASKAQGGKLPDVTKGQQERAFDQAIFAAKKGRIQGPVKTQFGWYVFEVSKITPASQQSLDQSKQTIKNLLRSQRQQKALDKWIKDFRQRYKDKTTCADDFKTAECSNGPSDKTNTGPASGGSPGGAQAPQGGAPQGGAPQGGAPQGGAPQGGAPQGTPQAPQGTPQQAPQPQPQTPQPQPQQP